MSIYKKLLLVKSELSAVKKDKNNPFFKSVYADINSYLEVVEPVLDKHGLLLLQPIENSEVHTVIFDPESEQRVRSSIKLPDIQDPQKLGSAITYYRRYTLASLLAMQAEDDDGNSASGKTEKPKPPAKTQSIYVYDVSTLLLNAEFKEWSEANGVLIDSMMLRDGKEIRIIKSANPIEKLAKYLMK